jgi:tetratricopeptide (TPR) repeat protein
MENDYEGALEEYMKLKPDYPDYAPLYARIGKLQLQLGRRREALESLQHAVELDPRVREPHYLLSNLYQEMGDAEAAARERQIFATLETIPERRTGY